MSPSCDIEDRRRAKHAVVPVGAHERNDSATLIDRRDGRDRSVIARIFPDERSKAAGRPHGQIVRLDKPVHRVSNGSLSAPTRTAGLS